MISSNEDKIIGITGGVMDLLHPGHLMMLEYCKRNCDHLIVVLQVDPSRYRAEKQRPIETVFERWVRLKACKYVDEIIPYESETDLENILESIEYDIRFVGEDHKGKSFTGDNIRPETIHFNPRPHKHSTTELRRRVVEGRVDNKRPEPTSVTEPAVPRFDHKYSKGERLTEDDFLREKELEEKEASLKTKNAKRVRKQKE